jgi:hypothetical protein
LVDIVLYNLLRRKTIKISQWLGRSCLCFITLGLVYTESNRFFFFFDRSKCIFCKTPLYSLGYNSDNFSIKNCVWAQSGKNRGSKKHARARNSLDLIEHDKGNDWSTSNRGGRCPNCAKQLKPEILRAIGRVVFLLCSRQFEILPTRERDRIVRSAVALVLLFFQNRARGIGCIPLSDFAPAHMP